MAIEFPADEELGTFDDATDPETATAHLNARSDKAVERATTSTVSYKGKRIYPMSLAIQGILSALTGDRSDAFGYAALLMLLTLPPKKQIQLCAQPTERVRLAGLQFQEEHHIARVSDIPDEVRDHIQDLLDDILMLEPEPDSDDEGDDEGK
ncbi:MAG: hypothetical protein AAF236_02160 [Verrucomicrobiota bacterium]